MSKLSKLINDPGRFFFDSKLNFRNWKKDGVVRKKQASDFLGRRYAELYENREIREKSIFYESFHGKTMSGNPLAIFKKLLSLPEFAEYKHIWALNSVSKCTLEDIPSNVEFVKVHSKRYLQCLTECKYLINNTTFPPYFTRRKEQLYLNTWHGTPLKTLGIDMNGTPGQHKNIMRNFLSSTHLLSPNRYTGDILVKSHEISDIYSGKVLEAGYPRIDLAVHGDKNCIRHRMGIQSDKPLLLFAPTWRGEVGSVKKNKSSIVKELNTLCEGLHEKYEIAFRGHILMQKHIKDEDLACQIVPDNIDTAELLSAVDFLITDYSSILFDYLVLKRPLALYSYDEERYAEERGFYFSLDQIPAYNCKTVDDLVDVAQRGDWWKTFSGIYEKFYNKFLYLDDGDASQRVIDSFFNGLDDYCYSVENHDKKTLFFYCGGFRHNGITSSAKNLFNFIDYTKYNVLLTEGADFHPEKDKNLKSLNPNVKKILRFGSCNTTNDERNVLTSYYRTGVLDTPSQKILERHFSRERRRLWGDTRLDVVIDFSGYVKFWTLLLGLSDVSIKVIYQHNDMLAENNKIVNRRYKHRHNFKVIFDAYRFFDKIISVSKRTMELNYEGLQEIVPQAETRFDFVTNSIDFKHIIERSEVDHSFEVDGKVYLHGPIVKIKNSQFVPVHPRPQPDEPNFIHIGRFSPEKCHSKLLEAFAEICKRVPEAKLFLVGEGVLFQAVKKMVHRLKLQNNVILTGQISNPYVLLKHCDCFVMSSDHEGQPMVLLEALVLNKPVIATDIVGCRGVLENGLGALVENSVDGLVEGMQDFIDGNVVMPEFDYEEYQQYSISQFCQKVCDDS